MLSQARFNEMLRSLSPQQRRVFDCVPIAEAWSFKQLNAEISRRGMNMRWDQFQGCVDALRQAGLVREPSPGMFKREPVRALQDPPIIVVEEERMPQDSKTKPPPAAKGSPIDLLAGIAQRVRTMADVAIQLHHEAVKLADDIEHVALEVEEGSEKNASAAQELARVREAMKTLFPMGAP